MSLVGGLVMSGALKHPYDRVPYQAFADSIGLMFLS
jgi:hypothetical protein